MKKFGFFIVMLMVLGIYNLIAQDLIVIKNGDIIEARVIEISLTEIRYRRIDFLDGPVFIIPTADVLSIRFGNGTHQVFNQVPGSGQHRTQVVRTTDTAIDPDKFIFGISANAGGILGIIMDTGGLTGLIIELGKGNFNSETNLGIGWDGFSSLITFNYFVHNRIGGFYIGGGLGHFVETLQLGLNIGHKFVTPSGIYFRTGSFIGYGFGWWNWLVFNPDISVGWTMR